MREAGMNQDLIDLQIDRIFLLYPETIKSIKNFLSENKVYQGILVLEGNDAEVHLNDVI